jgi:hypothetical protein
MRQRIGTARNSRTTRARPSIASLAGRPVAPFWSDLAIGSIRLAPSRRPDDLSAAANQPNIAAAIGMFILRCSFTEADTCAQPQVAYA